MAYDEEIADRIRALVSDEPDVTEKKMFGGLAFLIGGHMAISASNRGGIMVRVDRGHAARLLATTAAEQVEMRGGPVEGWLRVAADDVRTKRQLDAWVQRGAACARSLPPKAKPKPRRTA